eukprot:10406726-Alexandrium_andersonii.AAC.1
MCIRDSTKAARADALSGLGASSLRRLQAYPGLVFVRCGGEGNCGWNGLGVAMNYARQATEDAS